MGLNDSHRYRYSLTTIGKDLSLEVGAMANMIPRELVEAVENALFAKLDRLEVLEANEAKAVAVLEELGGDDVGR